MDFQIDLTGQVSDTNILYVTTTNINQDSEIVYTTDTVSNIISINDISQNITGDTAYFTVTNTFRTQILNQWSPWTDLTVANLNALLYKDVVYQFKSDISLLSPNFNLEIPFRSPLIGEAILSEFVVTYNNVYYDIPYNYPEQGALSMVIGFMNNDDYYLYDNGIEQKIFYKSNGYWISNKLIRTGVDAYIPIRFNNVVLTDSFIDGLNVGTTIPYNDYILTDNEFRFTSGMYPKIGDNITINPKYHYMLLNNNETIKILYSEPVVSDPEIVMGDISIGITPFIPTFTTPVIVLNDVGDKAVLKPSMHMKMYSLTGFDLEVNGYCLDTLPNCLDIKFRYSFDSKKLSTSPWIELKTENLTCLKGTPLKMFFVEFLFEKTCDNNGYPFVISDLILKGDLQILDNDYVKSNRFGLRSDCVYQTDKSGFGGDDESCDKPLNNYTTGFEDVCGDNSLWNPYNLSKPIALAEKLTNDISNQFGWDVDYYRLDPNNAGIDVFLHEYGVSDVTDKQTLKVLIPDNKFPEDQIQFNMFDLALFDSFEVHITKKEFHKVFGINTRPANGDFLFICQINKLFQVEHAQSFRDFANSALYYKVTLTKKNNDKNINNGSYSDGFDSLINNNATEILFGDEVKEQALNVADSMLLQNVTTLDDKVESIIYDKDIIVHNNENIVSKIMPTIYRSNVQPIDYLLDNITTVISQNYYDLSTQINTTAIEYVDINPDICPCCGISFSNWFNITSYVSGMVYNMFDISNSVGTGMRLDFIDGKFYLNYFGTSYMFTCDSQIKTNTWFGLILNISNEKAEIYVYKRDVTSTLKLVLTKSNDITAATYTGDMKFVVKGSNMRFTNMRLMKKTIELSNQNKFLNQYNIKNSGDLIVADNCVKQIYSKSFKF